jgi:SAM-dependent methyltransferase
VSAATKPDAPDRRTAPEAPPPAEDARGTADARDGSFPAMAAGSDRSHTERPKLDRRSEYKATQRQDEFMIPLLCERIAAALAQYAAPLPGRSALDVGCGGQPFRRDLEALGFRYTSYDAAQNVAGNVDVLGFIDTPLPPALIERGPFDFIICTEVLEHVADWAPAFRNLAQLLAPGGRLLATCPAFFQLHEEPYDYWRPTGYALGHFAKRAGLEKIHAENAGTPWDVIGTLVGSCYSLPRQFRFTDRVFSKLVNVFLGLAFRLLKSRFLQGRTDLKGGLYLSNVAVFEKSQAG